MMRLSGITQESFVDGPGIRMVLFAQGCTHHCPHCHNPESWPPGGGREYSVKQITRMIKRRYSTGRPIRGITFSGGEPFMQAAGFAEIARCARDLGWDICTYTGYLYEELIKSADVYTLALLDLTDILKDGPYIHERRDIGLKFKGSDNQRLIDMAATRRAGAVVLLD